MSTIAVEMENLQADVKAIHDRMLVERDVADYWYKRCMEAEENNTKIARQLYDALNNRLSGDESK